MQQSCVSDIFKSVKHPATARQIHNTADRLHGCKTNSQYYCWL